MSYISKEFLTKENGLLDKRAKVLAGEIYKRVDVLHREFLEQNKLDEKKSKLFDFYSKLYKSLTKELVYEEFRIIKEFLELIGDSKIEFINKKPEK